MNEIEYTLGDEQDEEKTDRELSEEELEAVAGGRKAARKIRGRLYHRRRADYPAGYNRFYRKNKKAGVFSQAGY